MIKTIFVCEIMNMTENQISWQQDLSIFFDVL